MVNKRKKVIVIDNCGDCPNLQEFGEECECSELFRIRLWKNIPKNIPQDCPLDGVLEYVLGQIGSFKERKNHE